MSGTTKQAGIYKITNIISKKIYIGSAVNCFRRLVREHLKDLKLNKHKNRHMQHAFNKHGEENFKFEVIEHIQDKTKLIEREQYYLDTLLFAQEFIKNKDKRFINLGYNLCPTAGSPLGYNHTLETRLKQSKVKQNIPLETRKLMSKSCKNIPPSKKGVKLKKEIVDKYKKQVYQLDLDGKIIKLWNSIGEACAFFNLHPTTISKVCTGKHKTSNGFKWKYVDENYFLHRKGFTIGKFDLNNNLLEYFTSVTKAYEKTDISKHMLSKCLKKPTKIDGFMWKKLTNNEFKQLIQDEKITRL